MQKFFKGWHYLQPWFLWPCSLLLPTFLIFDYCFWCIFLYWFYQCYKACHIPTPTEDSHNHLAIVSPTVIGIQNESVFCSKLRAFLKSLHARKQSFTLCVQFYSYIYKQTSRVHFVWNGPGCRVKQRVWICLVFPPQAGQGMDTLPTADPVPGKVPSLQSHNVRRGMLEQVSQTMAAVSILKVLITHRLKNL